MTKAKQIRNLACLQEPCHNQLKMATCYYNMVTCGDHSFSLAIFVHELLLMGLFNTIISLKFRF